MTFFRDLTPYTYSNGSYPHSKNVGWLELGHAFPTSPPSEEFLSRLWEFCKVSVAQTRGIHVCAFCAHGDATVSKRGGEQLLLGSSEIRVFSEKGEIFSAPTLIYHYVEAHEYEPPDEFRQAVIKGLSPPSKAYFDALAQFGLQWGSTSTGNGRRFRLRDASSR